MVVASLNGSTDSMEDINVEHSPQFDEVGADHPQAPNVHRNLNERSRPASARRPRSAQHAPQRRIINHSGDVTRQEISALQMRVEDLAALIISRNLDIRKLSYGMDCLFSDSLANFIADKVGRSLSMTMGSTVDGSMSHLTQLSGYSLNHPQVVPRPDSGELS